MAIVRVWAPRARAVAVQLGERRVPMRAEAGGWWRATLEDIGPGADYAFVLDEGDALPDPRSPWQPQGVFGPSRLVDLGDFRWSDTRWQAPPLASGVVYELHVGTFTPEGTFDAARAKLEHLVRLGITHVELMPVAEFPGRRGWGYDGVDLYAPSSAYGGPRGLQRLVDACHAAGLAVILDVVYNHLGPSGNFLSQFGPYFTDRYKTPWGAAVNFDGPGSDEVRRFFCDNALMWLRDYHLDGLRLDAVHAIVDASATHLLEQLAGEVERLSATLGRHLVLIAESDLNDPRLLRAREAGGYGLDAQWSDDFHHALHAALTGERAGYYADFGSLGDLAHALRHAYVYDGRYSAFRQRIHGRPATGLAGTRFLGYLQNHDQIGNRARGERSGALMSPGRLRVAAALVCLSPFVPMLFQGEEWGASTPFQYFTDHQDAELARAVSEGRRREFIAFGWKPEEVPDPQDPATFARCKLDWSEVAREPHRALLAWYQALLRLRREQPSLRDGRLDRVETACDDDARWFAMRRGSVVVVCNLADRAQRVRVPPSATDAPCTLLLASAPETAVQGDAVELPPDAVAVLRADGASAPMT